MTIDEIQNVIVSNLTDEQRFCEYIEALYEHIEALYDFNEYDKPYQVSLKYCPNCGKNNNSIV